MQGRRCLRVPERAKGQESRNALPVPTPDINLQINIAVQAQLHCKGGLLLFPEFSYNVCMDLGHSVRKSGIGRRILMAATIIPIEKKVLKMYVKYKMYLNNMKNIKKYHKNMS